MSVSAKVICDSSFRSTRLITLEVEFHRFVLSENNTHKAQSRNIQSSRAIPVLRQLEQIANNPAMPVEYRKNQSGMVAGEYLTAEEVEDCKKVILWMRDCCLIGVKQLHQIGLAKQWANRYVEPWMFTKGVVTATERDWKAMFKLRRHYAAQPEIKALFDAIYDAVKDSTPTTLFEGQWHLPYCEDLTLDLQDSIKVSASCVAQVSYRKLDDSLDKAVDVYNMLNLPENGVYPVDPPHFSPTEHIAKAGETSLSLSGNFQCNDFTQYRKVLEMGLEKEVINSYKENV